MNKKFKINLFVFLTCAVLLIPSFVRSQSTSLKLQYIFNQKTGTDSIIDETGNGYTGKLFGGAKIKKTGNIGILETGATNGYVDLGKKAGSIIELLTDFTISTYLFIDPSLNLNTNGNFVWTFSNSENINSSPLGCMFYTAKTSRFAISETNYSSEKQVNINSAATKSEWKHITYRQNGTTGEIYIDGILRKSGTISLFPATLGATSFNYLARACYSGDQYLQNSKYYDFRIYNEALSPIQISALVVNIGKLDTLTFTDLVDSALFKLSLGNLSAVSTNLTLPESAEGSVSIQWSSSKINVVSNQGVVNRPSAGSPNATLTLTATLTKNFISKTKLFNVTVLSQLTNSQSVEADAANLKLSGNLKNLRSNLQLPASGVEGSAISWQSDKPSFLSKAGIIISRPGKGNGNEKVMMTATLTKGASTSTKTFEVYVAEDEGFTGYLFTYFTGNTISQEAIRFALSNDGLTYKALNKNQPIIASSAISLTGGVRDPHILRGENGLFYMVVTDMVSANGWNSNRGMVLLKSSDLVNWTSATVNIPTAFPSEFASVDRVWAPQTIYDSTLGKYMIYFSMRKGGSDYDKIYYAYANSSFTALESAPKQLYFNPTGTSCIDGDIIEMNGQFHLFYKTEGSGNGIKKAVSNKLTEGWALLDKYLDQNVNAVEGGCVFRLFNTDDYILMYDVYSSGYYEFTKSTDLENFTVVNGNSFDFSPRHGTVIPVTTTEMQALNNKWMNTDVVEVDENAYYQVFPSPANDFVVIKNLNPDFLNSEVLIFDLHGRELKRKPISLMNEQISLLGLQSGLYFGEIRKNGMKIQTFKIVRK
jgi:hypothetical protein